MERTEDLLGIPSPLYYRLILIEGGVKSNLREVYCGFVCGERRLPSFKLIPVTFLNQPNLPCPNFQIVLEPTSPFSFFKGRFGHL
jgi:hypothetical protein